MLIDHLINDFLLTQCCSCRQNSDNGSLPMAQLSHVGSVESSSPPETSQEATKLPTVFITFLIGNKKNKNELEIIIRRDWIILYSNFFSLDFSNFYLFLFYLSTTSIIINLFQFIIYLFLYLSVISSLSTFSLIKFLCYLFFLTPSFFFFPSFFRLLFFSPTSSSSASTL